MKCPYVYGENDELVKNGQKQIGEVCGLKYGTERYQGYCPAHARQMGTISEEDLEYERQRRAATKQERRERKDVSTEKLKEVLTANGTTNVNHAVLEAMNLNDTCSLQEEYALFKQLNQNPTFVSYDEKMAFARWLESPAHLRDPETIDEAAEILGVSVKTLIAWKSAPEVIDFINSDTEMRMLGMFKFAMYKLGVNIDRGDPKSIDVYKRWYDEKQAQRNKKARSMNVPADLQKEADDYARATGEQNRGPALTAEKKMVNDAYFTKPEEVEQ